MLRPIIKCKLRLTKKSWVSSIFEVLIILVIFLGGFYLVAKVPVIEIEAQTPYIAKIPYNLTFTYETTVHYNESHIKSSNIDILERGDIKHWRFSVPPDREVRCNIDANSSYYTYIIDKPDFTEWMTSNRTEHPKSILYEKNEYDLYDKVFQTTDQYSGDYVLVIENPTIEEPTQDNNSVRIEIIVYYADGTTSLDRKNVGCEHLELRKAKITSYWSVYEERTGTKTEYRWETRYNTTIKKITLLEKLQATTH